MQHDRTLQKYESQPVLRLTRPDEDNLSETHSTLNFGNGIRKIELGM